MILNNKFKFTLWYTYKFFEQAIRSTGVYTTCSTPAFIVSYIPVNIQNLKTTKLKPLIKNRSTFYNTDMYSKITSDKVGSNDLFGALALTYPGLGDSDCLGVDNVINLLDRLGS